MALGTYGKNWEYTQGTHKRWLWASSFRFREVEEIASQLVNEKDTNCYKLVRCQGSEFYVHLDRGGIVKTPLSKLRDRRIRTNRVEELVELRKD